MECDGEFIVYVIHVKHYCTYSAVPKIVLFSLTYTLYSGCVSITCLQIMLQIVSRGSAVAVEQIFSGAHWDSGGWPHEWIAWLEAAARR